MGAVLESTRKELCNGAKMALSRSHFGIMLAYVELLLDSFLVSFWEFLVRFWIFFCCFGAFLVRTLSSLGPRAELLPQANEIDAWTHQDALIHPFY